jgi:hypothetical protein
MTSTDRKNYYLAYVYFHLACLAQKEVQRFTKMLAEIMGEDNSRLSDSLADNIYDPDTNGTEEEFEKIFRAHGVQMDWIEPTIPKITEPESDSVVKKRKVK